LHFGNFFNLNHPKFEYFLTEFYRADLLFLVLHFTAVAATQITQRVAGLIVIYKRKIAIFINSKEKRE